MLKVIALLARKPGMSREAFIRHYETTHAPLGRKLFPQMINYRRNFIDLTGAIFGTAAGPPDFDVITEIWFEDRASFEAMLASNANPEIGSQIAADEENFLDRSKTRFFVVEEHGGPVER